MSRGSRVAAESGGRPRVDTSTGALPAADGNRQLHLVHEVALVVHARYEVATAVAARRDLETGLAQRAPGPRHPKGARGIPEDLKVIRVKLHGEVEDFDCPCPPRQGSRPEILFRPIAAADDGPTLNAIVYCSAFFSGCPVG